MVEKLDFYGSKTQLETLNNGQIFTLVFSTFVSYFVMLMCGTLGAPSHVTHIVSTCDVNIH
jgi:hypothetical protein